MRLIICYIVPEFTVDPKCFTAQREKEKKGKNNHITKVLYQNYLEL